MDTLQCFDGVEIESLGYLHDPFWSEGVLGVYHHHIPIQTSLIEGHGSVDSELEAHLGLSTSEFTEELNDRLSLQPATKKVIECL